MNNPLNKFFIFILLKEPVTGTGSFVIMLSAMDEKIN
jgi:hypothetical protein